MPFQCVLSQVNLGNGTSETFAYNDRFQMKEQELKKGAEVLQKYDYGRQVKATRAGVPDAWTVYDALGNRVATKINDVWRYVVYDAFGKCVAEYGQLADGVGGVKYVQQDWQGSVRTVTNANGFVVSRTDHQAFGGEVGYGVGKRTIEQGYNVDKATRQGYGLTERDDATGLDHTWFRKNENSAGRWTSPDPYKGSMSLGDPQSFNRYSYVTNDPVNFVDPSGLQENQWVCELWTTYRDPDGPKGPIEPYEVGPRFWQCYVVPTGGGPSETVTVNANGDGGGGQSNPPPPPQQEGYCNTSLGFGPINIGYITSNPTSRNPTATVYPTVGLGRSWGYPYSFTRTYGEGPVQTGLSGQLTTSNGLATVTSLSTSGFSREVGVGSPTVGLGGQITGPGIPLTGSTAQDSRNNPHRTGTGGYRFGPGRCPY